MELVLLLKVGVPRDIPWHIMSRYAKIGYVGVGLLECIPRDHDRRTPTIGALCNSAGRSVLILCDRPGT